MAGTYSEGLHWTKTPTGDKAEMVRRDFRDRRSVKTGFPPKEWETYHAEMLTFRNKYVAHIDLSQKFSFPIPNFEPALQAAYAYEEWVKALIRASVGKFTPVIWDNPALILIYEQCKGAAFSAINSYTAGD